LPHAFQKGGGWHPDEEPVRERGGGGVSPIREGTTATLAASANFSCFKKKGGTGFRRLAGHWGRFGHGVGEGRDGIGGPETFFFLRSGGEQVVGAWFAERLYGRRLGLGGKKNGGISFVYSVRGGKNEI